MPKYDLNFLTRRFFPWFWKTDTNLSLCDLLQSSLDKVNEDYEDKEIDTRQRVGYSIQRLSLESGLNDRFDDTLRRIQVVNGESRLLYVYNAGEFMLSGEIFVYNEAEIIPVDKDEVYVFNIGESVDAVTAFNVYAPLGLQDLEQEIKAYIEAVLITGTEYILTFV